MEDKKKNTGLTVALILLLLLLLAGGGYLYYAKNSDHMIKVPAPAVPPVSTPEDKKVESGSAALAN